MNTLDEKILDTGAYYVAQQVAANVNELKEHNFNNIELDFLKDKGVEYVEELIKDNYKPYTDLSIVEVDAIKSGLESYPVYGLINDWQLGIDDFQFDQVMLNYLENKRGSSNRHNRLYRTILDLYK